MYLIGMAIFILGACLGMRFKGINPEVIANEAAIFINLMALLSVLTASKGYRLFIRALKAVALPKTYSLSDDEYGKAASMFRQISRITVVAMLLGMLFGIVAMLGNLDDIDVLSHALSAALVAPIWGLLLIGGIYEPMVMIMKKRQSESKHSKKQALPDEAA